MLKWIEAKPRTNENVVSFGFFFLLRKTREESKNHFFSGRTDSKDILLHDKTLRAESKPMEILDSRFQPSSSSKKTSIRIVCFTVRNSMWFSFENIFELISGGIDSPSLNCFDPILKRYVQITKYLCFNSKTTTQKYIDDLYERIVLTSELSHVNVRQILSWYIADACIYSVTDVLRGTLRQAIESEHFSIDRIQLLAFQIVQGTLYLHSKGFCPLTPWWVDRKEFSSSWTLENWRFCFSIEELIDFKFVSLFDFHSTEGKRHSTILDSNNSSSVCSAKLKSEKKKSPADKTPPSF